MASLLFWHQGAASRCGIAAKVLSSACREKHLRAVAWMAANADEPGPKLLTSAYLIIDGGVV